MGLLDTLQDMLSEIIMWIILLFRGDWQPSAALSFVVVMIGGLALMLMALFVALVLRPRQPALVVVSPPADEGPHIPVGLAFIILCLLLIGGVVFYATLS